MVILTPKGASGPPDYTFFFMPGLMEKADNYRDMYINPQKDIKFKLPKAKYNISPFQEKLPGDNYRLVFI